MYGYNPAGKWKTSKDYQYLVEPALEFGQPQVPVDKYYQPDLVNWNLEKCVKIAVTQQLTEQINLLKYLRFILSIEMLNELWRLTV